MDSKIKNIKKVAEQLLKLMQQEAEVEVVAGEENEVVVKVKSEDPGIIIGWKGRNLSALQYMLGIMMSCKTKEWTRIVVDVNDYRKEQQDKLTDMAGRAAQQVKESGEEVVLGRMSAFERRMIHIALKEDGEVETYSEGEGESRHVIVSPKGAERKIAKEESQEEEKRWINEEGTDTGIVTAEDLDK